MLQPQGMLRLLNLMLALCLSFQSIAVLQPNSFVFKLTSTCQLARTLMFIYQIVAYNHNQKLFQYT